jgi:hypothetical protein
MKENRPEKLDYKARKIKSKDDLSQKGRLFLSSVNSVFYTSIISLIE